MLDLKTTMIWAKSCLTQRKSCLTRLTSHLEVDNGKVYIRMCVNAYFEPKLTVTYLPAGINTMMETTTTCLLESMTNQRSLLGLQRRGIPAGMRAKRRNFRSCPVPGFKDFRANNNISQVAFKFDEGQRRTPSGGEIISRV